MHKGNNKGKGSWQELGPEGMMIMGRRGIRSYCPGLEGFKGSHNQP